MRSGLIALLFTLNLAAAAAAADGLSLADFPEFEASQRCDAVLKTVELAAADAEDFRRSVAGVDLKREKEAIRESYPTNLRAVHDWKTKAREMLRNDLEAKGVKNADLFARSIVNKIQNEIRVAEGLVISEAEVGSTFDTALAILRNGRGGWLGNTIQITEKASQRASKVLSISKKLAGWVDSVERIGLFETRKIKGYHDENIGHSSGTRSIRLNDGVRATYQIGEDKKILIIGVGNDLYDH